jgi:hypothetical protein
VKLCSWHDRQAAICAVAAQCSCTGTESQKHRAAHFLSREARDQSLAPPELKPRWRNPLVSRPGFFELISGRRYRITIDLIREQDHHPMANARTMKAGERTHRAS